MNIEDIPPNWNLFLSNELKLLYFNTIILLKKFIKVYLYSKNPFKFITFNGRK
jgi:hypothetical protein